MTTKKPRASLHDSSGEVKALHKRKPPPAADTIGMDAIKRLGIDGLVDYIEDGWDLREIARELRVQEKSIRRWIAADPERSARAKEARVRASQAWEEHAARLIREAKDPFELAKAKELAHHMRWRASRIDPARYGDRVEVDARVGIANLSEQAINDRLARLIASAGADTAPRSEN